MFALQTRRVTFGANLVRNTSVTVDFLETLVVVRHKSVPQGCHIYKSVSQECPTRVFRKSVPHKSVPQECPKSAKSECHTRVPRNKNVRQECPARVSHKNVLQESPTRVSYKNVPQECPTRASAIPGAQESHMSGVRQECVLQGCPARAHHKRVPQKLQLVAQM